MEFIAIPLGFLVVRGLERVGNYDPHSSKRTLHDEARRGKIDHAIQLIKNGASLDSKDENDLTPLHLSSGAGHTEITRCLIVRGADFATKGTLLGFLPIHLAAMNGHSRIIEILIDHGADIEAKDNFGHTALHLAAGEGKTSAVRFLMEKGADMAAEDLAGETALDLAKAKGHNKVARFLQAALQTSRGTKQLAKADTPLLCAVKKGADETVRHLLDNGADLNEKDEMGRTALHHSVARKHTSTTELLISKGADANMNDALQMTPLHYLCMASNTDDFDVARMLLEGGADASIKHDEIGTPLDIAIKGGKTELVRLLEAAIQNPSAPAYSVASPVSSHASPACSPTLPKSLSDFVPENDSQEAKEELIKHGSKNVRTLRKVSILRSFIRR